MVCIYVKWITPTIEPNNAQKTIEIILNEKSYAPDN